MSIIWPLKNRLFQPLFFQQQPIWTGNRPKPTVPALMPWDMGLPNICSVSVDSFRILSGPKPPFPLPSEPNVIHEIKPYPPTYFRITGTTKDSSGAALGSCVVDMFRTSDDAKLDSTTSDASGLFEFRYAGQPPTTYYLVAYKTGSPNVAGTTDQTLTGA